MRDRGQSLVEFALVFPIFLLLLFGLIDMGRYVYTINALNQAAREGARYGSVSSWSASCSDTRETCIKDETLGRLAGVRSDTTTVTVTCHRYAAGQMSSPSVAACRANDSLQVQLKGTFQVLTPIIGQFIGSAPISGSAEVSVNQ